MTPNKRNQKARKQKIRERVVGEYESWIRQMYDKYKAVLFIEKYHLKMRFKKESEDYYLASKFNYPYLDAEIIYSDESIKDWEENKRDAERRIIHEFCHTITDHFYSIVMNFPTKDAVEQARERMTDHIAQIVNKHFELRGRPQTLRGKKTI